MAKGGKRASGSKSAAKSEKSRESSSKSAAASAVENPLSPDRPSPEALLKAKEMLESNPVPEDAQLYDPEAATDEAAYPSQNEKNIPDNIPPSEISWPTMDTWDAMSHEDKCRVAGVPSGGPTPLAPHEAGYVHGLTNVPRVAPEPEPLGDVVEFGAKAKPPSGDYDGSYPTEAAEEKEEEPFEPFIAKAGAAPMTDGTAVEMLAHESRRQGFPWIPMPTPDRLDKSIEVEFWQVQYDGEIVHLSVWCNNATIGHGVVQIHVNSLHKEAPYLIPLSSVDGLLIPKRVV